ncbi:MAG: hypothetical protein AAGA75_15830, partial [Cyanobacteria bacterium P01_E01_bin.6]
MVQSLCSTCHARHDLSSEDSEARQLNPTEKRQVSDTVLASNKYLDVITTKNPNPVPPAQQAAQDLE